MFFYYQSQKIIRNSTPITVEESYNTDKNKVGHQIMIGRREGNLNPSYF